MQVVLMRDHTADNFCVVDPDVFPIGTVFKVVTGPTIAGLWSTSSHTFDQRAVYVVEDPADPTLYIAVPVELVTSVAQA